jgi:hypothetical protein
VNFERLLLSAAHEKGSTLPQKSSQKTVIFGRNCFTEKKKNFKPVLRELPEQVRKKTFVLIRLPASENVNPT